MAPCWRTEKYDETETEISTATQLTLPICLRLSSSLEREKKATRRYQLSYHIFLFHLPSSHCVFISPQNCAFSYAFSSDPTRSRLCTRKRRESTIKKAEELSLSSLLHLGGNVGGLRGLGPPGLGLAAVGVGAHRTAHEELRAAARALAQVRLDDVGQPGDEERVVVGRGAAGDALRADLLADVLGVLDVQLVEGLDVLVDEGDGDEHQVLVAALHQGWEKEGKL